MALLLWEKAKDFLQRAFTVIFWATIVIWFLQSFDTRLNVVSDSSKSLLALIGQWIAPVFKPTGFGNWRMVTSLITGFTAKEAVVSTMSVLLGVGMAELPQALGALFTRKLIILIAVVVLSVLFFRPFCKWICPLGAFYALMNKVSLLGIQVDTSKCVSCGKCARTCQMDVDITKSPNDTECIRCGKCIRACPTQAIRFRYGFGLSGNTNPKQVSNHQNQTEES